MPPPPTAPVPDRPALRILATVALTFIGYSTIALPLAVLPTYVAHDLGFGAVVAGIAISTQYVATVVSRSQVGLMSDLYGPKRAVLLGFLGCLLSGVLTVLAALCPGRPVLSLGLILLGRLSLGIAESWVSTGAITWAIGQVGPAETVRIISWNGIATYGALAIGAPVGVTLVRAFGFASIGLCACALALVGLGWTLSKPPVAVLVEKRMGQRSVIARVMPYGLTLALAATGFGVIATFIALYFASRQWQGAALSLSLFGLGFILARLLLGRYILRYGGLRVTLVSFAVEGTGLVLLWLAPVPLAAMIGAGIAGFGFAPIFPALGVEAVSRVPPQNRGAAIGLYSVFLDVALGVTGPVAGLLIQRFGAASPFWLAAGASMVGIAMTGALLSR